MMPSQTSPKFMMRISSHLHERVKRAAAANNRSMNGEIVFALEVAYPKPVEPESINKALAQATLDIVNEWADVLAAIGQDPDSNERLKHVRDVLARASSEARSSSASVEASPPQGTGS